MKGNALIILSAIIVYSTPTLAETVGDQATTPIWQRVGTLSLGPEWTSAGQTQTFFLQPDLQKTYLAQRNTNTLGEAELFLGLQHDVYPHLQAQFGVAFAATTNTRLNGTVWEDADPAFNNYDYSYAIEHAYIAVMSKVLTDLHQVIQPYVSGSIGVGFNHAYGFDSTPRIPQEISAPPFSSHSMTAFSYTLGTGLQKRLSEHWHVGVGYEFSDWGKSSLAAAAGQTLNSGLTLQHLYTNQLQFSLSYIG